MQPPERKPSANGDVLFRKIIIVSTALSLAVAYGWLAGFVRQANGDIIFHWRWLILIWALVGYVTTVYFWRQIWPPSNRNATRIGIALGVIAAAFPGIWWLIFPLRSQSGAHLHEVAEGLIAAAVVLAFGGWLIFRLGKAFEEK
ncbi:MAG: hypothetical protein ACREE6_10090 [Limisphaerales bacterium]